MWWATNIVVPGLNCPGMKLFRSFNTERIFARIRSQYAQGEYCILAANWKIRLDLMIDTPSAPRKVKR